jgi:photosystem II stability/assembly factor-like uncharacterized protein
MNDVVVIRVKRRVLYGILTGLVVLGVVVLSALPLSAQKVQEEYEDKFDILGDSTQPSLAVSSDGKYVYLAGDKGIVMSDDFGKTGSWVQTVRIK